MLTNPNSSKLSQTSFELFLMELICIFILLTQICFFFILLLKPQQINNCDASWHKPSQAHLGWACTLQHVLCLCASLHSGWGCGRVQGTCSQWAETFRIYFFFPFGFKSLKDTLSPNRRFWQKKFPTKMVTNLTNLTLPSAEVIYSLFGTYMCIRQNFVLLAYNGSECIPRHLSAWYIEMNDGLDGAGVHEGCESSTESLGREAVCGARREMLLNSQSNKEK